MGLVEVVLDDLDDLNDDDVLLVDFRAAEGCFLFYTKLGEVFKYYIKLNLFVSK